jgi:hypothetical protein
MARSPYRALRVAHLLQKSTPAILLLMLLTGLCLPLYSDEVGWRLQERAALDGVDKLFSEQCGPNTLAVPPWFMWPVRWYSGFFNSAWPDPFAVRLSGVAYAIVWVAMLVMLIRQATEDRLRRRQLTVLCCGLMGLGVTPWLLIWSRPEQPIILAATASLLIACSRAGDTSARWWAPPAILMLGVIALSYHFKALILMPLFIASMILAGPVRRTWLIQGLCALALLAVAAVSARYWFGRIACPDNPILAAQHADQNLGLQVLTGHERIMGILRLIANYQMPVYVAEGAPNVWPMSNWLPSGLVSKPSQFAWTAAMIALWLAGFAPTVRTLATAMWERKMNRNLWLGAVTLACASAWCMTELVRNVYEASFILPLLALTYALILSPRALPARVPRALRRAAMMMGLALPISAMAILALYGPWLISAAGKGGYLPEQPYSVGLADYPKLRGQILHAAAACGIAPQNHPARLLVDDVTYFTFMDAPLPDHASAVFQAQSSGGPMAPLAYLKMRRSSGVVVGCNALPAALRSRAHATGSFCCIGPAQF